LEKPLVFREYEAPEFLHNQHMKMARLLALRTDRLYLTGEVEVHPVTGHEGPEGEYKFSSTLSLILVLDDVDV
jgi:hypothetical protein